MTPTETRAIPNQFRTFVVDAGLTGTLPSAVVTVGSPNTNGFFGTIKIAAMYNTIPVPPNNTIKTNTTTDNTTVTNTTDNTTKTNTVVDNTKTTTTDNTTADNSTKSLSATNVPAPHGNVKYSVQIAALHNAKGPNVLATMYSINEPVNTEMAEGFTKYTVGSHTEYKSARDARETIKNKGVVGPFVTAYSTGKRITVQEALMITSQKWYK